MALRINCRLLLAAIVLLAGFGTANAKDLKAGKALAQKHCARCHNIELTGTSSEKLAPPFRTFIKKWPVSYLEEALAEGIVVGHDIMPEFEFEPKDITNLLDFIDDLGRRANKK